MAEYQHASDWYPGKPPFSGVIRTGDGRWIANQAVDESPEWAEYLEWAKVEGNNTDPYLHPGYGGATIVLQEGEEPVGVMLDSLPEDQGGNPIEGMAPKNVDVPHLQPDSANVGDTLTCTMGNWEGEPKGYTGRWLRDDDLTGEEGSEYVVKSEDAGHSISCVVSCFNNYGTGIAPRSNAVAIPAAPTGEEGGETQTRTSFQTQGVILGRLGDQGDGGYDPPHRRPPDW